MELLLQSRVRTNTSRVLCVARGAGKMSEDSGTEKPGRNYQSIGLAATLGFGIAISLAVLVGGGVWLDTRLNSAPLWTIIGLALGIIAAGYQLYELALASRKDRKSGPIATKLANRQKGKGR